MLRDPPPPTLFPYTTLFRSLAARTAGGPARGDGGLRPLRRRPARGGDRRALRDRKSTRLNSSHVAISYAVFCLKKKKEQHKFMQPTLDKYDTEGNTYYSTAC